MGEVGCTWLVGIVTANATSSAVNRTEVERNIAVISFLSQDVTTIHLDSSTNNAESGLIGRCYIA